MSNSESSRSPKISPGRSSSSARAVTLAQLAEYVGVSSAAVSVVLNNTQSRIKVSQETRERILRGARELNYQPNALARSLINRQTNVIGFCTTLTHMFNPMYPFLGSLLQGMLAGCKDAEKNLLLYSRVADVSEQDLSLEVLNGQLDGLVLFAYQPSVFTRRLSESHLSVVTVADAVPGYPCVRVDDDLGGRLLARHLVEKGYKNALYWAPHHAFSSSIENRTASYLDEAAKLGLKAELYREQYPLEIEIEKIMARPAPPDVISVYCDYVAVEIINKLQGIGVKIPRDVAVTGFDGVPGSYPALTTVRAPWKAVAQTAVALLVQQRNGQSIPIQTTLPVELDVSETA